MADFEKVYSIKFKVDKAKKDLADLDKVLEKIEKNKLVKTLAKLEAAFKNLDDQAKTTRKSLDKAVGAKAKHQIRALGKETKKTDKKMKAFGRTARNTSVDMQVLGTNIKRYVVLPLLAIGGASTKMAMDFNKSMANVSTLLTGGQKQLQDFKTGVQDLAKETGKSTGDLSEGLYQVVSALGESTENMDQLKIASKAAVAGLSNTGDSIKMLTAVGKGYNDVSAEALKHTSDLAFQTVKLGVTTFPELADSMGRVVPLAAALNTSQEELFGTMATLTGVTGNTAEVTTQLASVYSAFMKPSGAMTNAVKEVNKQSDEYNFKSAAMMAKTLGLQKTLKLLGGTVDNDSDALAKMFKRKEAVLAVLPLLSTQSENYEKKLLAMRTAIGATDDAYRKQTEGINKQGHEWEKTKQRMVVFSQRIGERLLPVLDKLLEFAEPIIEWLENMDEGSIDAAISVGSLVVQFALAVKVLTTINAVGGAAIGVLGGIGATSAGSVTGVTALTGAMSKLPGVIGAAVLAYQALDFASQIFDKSKSAKKQRKRDEGIANRTARTTVKDRLKTMSESELKKDIASEQKTIAELPKSDLAASFESRDKLMQTFASWGGGVERPIDQAKRERDAAVARKTLFEAELGRRQKQNANNELQSLGGTRGGSGFGLDPFAGTGAGGGGGGKVEVNAPVNVNVAGTNASPQAIGAHVERAIKKVAGQMRRAVDQAGASEI